MSRVAMIESCNQLPPVGSAVYDEGGRYWEELAWWIFAPPVLVRASQEVSELERLVGLDRPARVLDLCCGVGRHALELARRGHDVTGVDSTVSYLRHAEEAAVRAGLVVRFVVGDMRRYSRPGSFDVALSLGSSLGYFEDPEDDVTVLRHLREALRPGGVLVVELMGKEVVARRFLAREVYEDGDRLVVIQRRVTRNWCWLENHLTVTGPGGRRPLLRAHRLYSAAELVALFDAVGLSDVRCYGGLDGSAYDQDAQRLVLTGRR